MSRKKEIRCCDLCGRDTAGHTCAKCRGARYHSDEYRGRRAFGSAVAGSLDAADDRARHDDSGWAYDDEDYLPPEVTGC